MQKKWRNDWKKKNIQLILIEPIPGNRSEEQAEFISSIWSPTASTERKVFMSFVFLNNVMDTLNLPSERQNSSMHLSFSSCWLGVVGNAVFRRNYERVRWISNSVPYDTATALQGVVLWHTASVSLSGEAHTVCRLSVVGRGLLWNWL